MHSSCADGVGQKFPAGHKVGETLPTGQNDPESIHYKKKRKEDTNETNYSKTRKIQILWFCAFTESLLE